MGQAVPGQLFWELPGWGGRRKGRARLKQAITDAAQGRCIQYEAQVVGAAGARMTIDLSVKPVHVFFLERAIRSTEARRTRGVRRRVRGNPPFMEWRSSRSSSAKDTLNGCRRTTQVLLESLISAPSSFGALPISWEHTARLASFRQTPSRRETLARLDFRHSSRDTVSRSTTPRFRCPGPDKRR